MINVIHLMNRKMMAWMAEHLCLCREEGMESQARARGGSYGSFANRGIRLACLSSSVPLPITTSSFNQLNSRYFN